MNSKYKNTSKLIDSVACIILAGGEGTRLFPLTAKRCKPAVMFGGHHRLIDIPISNSLNSHLKKIFVISQFFSNNLNQYIKETYNLDTLQGGKIELLCPERTQNEDTYEGTADAVRKNLEEILKSDIEYILILSGDQLYNMDLEDMVAFAKEKNADLTIAALPIEGDEASRMGVLKTDQHSNIVDFFEKPKDPAILKRFALSDSFLKNKKIKKGSKPHYLSSMGIYVFKRDVLIDLLKNDIREDFGKHIIPNQIKKGKTAAYYYDGYWEDIGTVASFYHANLSLTTNSLGLNLYNEKAPIYTQQTSLPSARLVNTRIKDAIICEGSVIEADEITHCMIGQRCHIAKGTIVRDSIIMGNEFYTPPLKLDKQFPDHFGIGKNCLIQKAIIDENTLIGDNVKLTNEKKLTTFDGDGIYIRDGIIIVTSGTELKNGFTL